MKKIFLGGTCNESTWRNKMEIYLHAEGLSYFNPVVEDWTDACMAQEIQERKTCDFVLYTITPKSDSVYSIAEVIDDSNKQPEKTILILLREDGKRIFSKEQWKHLSAVAEMVIRNGGQFFDNLKTAAMYLGKQ